MAPPSLQPPARGSRLGRIPRAIWTLGLVSLLMDVSSEMIHSLLPVFFVAVLGASPIALGLMEGLAEGTGSILKLFSGFLSDRLGRRKPLALFGYGLSMSAKPLFALAAAAEIVFVARFADRIGKGIRGAPRDALIADLAPADLRDASYGLRQSLDTIGALVGPLLASALMVFLLLDLRAVYWLAIVPAAASVLLLSLGVREPDREPAARLPAMSPRWADMARLGRRCYTVIALAAAITFARLTEAFLLLRGETVGLELALIPLVMALMNIAYAGTALPIGLIAARVGRPALIALGVALLLAGNITLTLARSPAHLGIGAVLWGLHMGCTQGLLTAMIADSVAPDRRGTAFGLYHAATGLAVLFSSTLAGLIWTFRGPAETFAMGAAIAAIALITLPFTVRRART